MEYNYDVFLSYRHRPLDNIITQKTLVKLESFRLPKSLRGQGREMRRVFRDTEELAVSRILTDTIDKALRSTNCLVVICSTDTPSSEWIDREVAMFIELGRPDKIFPLLISGDPEHSFPPSLGRIPDIMDRVMDVRCEGNDAKKILRKEDTALLKVLAEATGVDYRALQRENGLRKLRRFTAGACTAAAVFAGVAAVSLGLMNMAQDYRDEAQAAEKASMQVLEQLTYGLPDKLTAVPGAYGKLCTVLQENAEQINSILLLSTDTAAAEQEVAANYEKLATALSVLGGYEDAITYQQQALALYESGGNTEATASAYNNLGKLQTGMGDYAAAAESYETAIRLQREAGTDPVTLAAMLANAGSNAAANGSNDAALLYLTESAALLADCEQSFMVLQTRANTAYSHGVVLYRQGDYAAAEEKLLAAAADREALCEQLDSLENKNGLLQTVSLLALTLTDEGRFDEAEAWYQQAIETAEGLAADGENMSSAANLAMLYNNCGINYNMQAKFAEAGACYARAAELFGSIAENSGAAADIAAYAEACMNAGDNYYKTGDYAKAKTSFAEGLAAYGKAGSGLGEIRTAEYTAWQAYDLLIFGGDTETALDTALAAYRARPDNVLTNMVLGYVCLYTGYYEDCDYLLGAVAALGGGQAEMIRLDIEAQQRAGLYSPHTEQMLQMLGEK